MSEVRRGTKPNVSRLEVAQQAPKREAVQQRMQIVDPPPSRSLPRKAAIPNADVTVTPAPKRKKCFCESS